MSMSILMIAAGGDGVVGGWLEIAELVGAEGGTVELHHGEAEGGEGAADLAVAPLGEDDRKVPIVIIFLVAEDFEFGNTVADL